MPSIVLDNADLVQCHGVSRAMYEKLREGLGEPTIGLHGPLVHPLIARHASKRNCIAASKSSRHLMRQISALGMEDPVYGAMVRNLTHPSHVFEDMSAGDIPDDMLDMITVHSDPTATQSEGIDVEAFEKSLGVLHASASQLFYDINSTSNAKFHRSKTSRMHNSNSVMMQSKSRIIEHHTYGTKNMYSPTRSPSSPKNGKKIKSYQASSSTLPSMPSLGHSTSNNNAGGSGGLHNKPPRVNHNSSKAPIDKSNSPTLSEFFAKTANNSDGVVPTVKSPSASSRKGPIRKGQKNGVADFHESQGRLSTRSMTLSELAKPLSKHSSSPVKKQLHASQNTLPSLTLSEVMGQRSTLVVESTETPASMSSFSPTKNGRKPVSASKSWDGSASPGKRPVGHDSVNRNNPSGGSGGVGRTFTDNLLFEAAVALQKEGHVSQSLIYDALQQVESSSHHLDEIDLATESGLVRRTPGSSMHQIHSRSPSPGPRRYDMKGIPEDRSAIESATPSDDNIPGSPKHTLSDSHGLIQPVLSPYQVQQLIASKSAKQRVMPNIMALYPIDSNNGNGNPGPRRGRRRSRGKKEDNKDTNEQGKESSVPRESAQVPPPPPPPPAVAPPSSPKKVKGTGSKKLEPQSHNSDRVESTSNTKRREQVPKPPSPAIRRPSALKEGKIGLALQQQKQLMEQRQKQREVISALASSTTTMITPSSTLHHDNTSTTSNQNSHNSPTSSLLEFVDTTTIIDDGRPAKQPPPPQQQEEVDTTSDHIVMKRLMHVDQVSVAL